MENNKLGWIVPNNGTLSLAEWNEQRRQYWSDMATRHLHPDFFPNGLLCPKDGGYLYDTMQTLSVSPNIYRVKCITCDYRGERYE